METEHKWEKTVKNKIETETEKYFAT